RFLHVCALAASSAGVLLFYVRRLPPPRSTLFPYTTLFRSQYTLSGSRIFREVGSRYLLLCASSMAAYCSSNGGTETQHTIYRDADRKSTRLNSSHRTISYAVFCLKKKTKPMTRRFAIM